MTVEIEPFRAIAISRIAHEMKVQGQSVIHMEFGQPSTGAPSRAIAEAHRVVDAEAGGYWESPNLRARVAKLYKDRYGVVIDPERVIMTAGASPALVVALNMRFGLWFEPEMVNENSDLYRAHPDWVLGPADQIRADTQRIGVVDGRDQRHPLGLRRGELGRVLAFDEAHGVRRRALRDAGLRGQLARDEERDDLVEVLDLADVHRLHDAGREDLLADPVLDVGDVVGPGLGDRALGDRVAVQRRHLEGEAQVLLHLLGDRVEVGHAGAELAQRHVLDVLRPDRRETGDGAAADGQAGRRGGPLQRLPAGDTGGNRLRRIGGVSAHL